MRSKLGDSLLYTTSFALTALGACYSLVPLYKLFCQSTGFGGTPKTGHQTLDQSKMNPNLRKKIKVSFTGAACNSLPWTFKPLQRSITVRPGETALAFYSAENTSNREIVGVASYNVVPDLAGAYFNKIQCFCFEEQKLLPGEQVDMPIFFYIDPDILNDPQLYSLTDVALSYSFFEVKNPTNK